MHKHIIGFLAAFALCVGCSTAKLEFDCATAERTYQAYQELVASGAVDIDEDVVRNAKLAAAFLSLYCGWDAQQAPAAKVLGGTVPACDANGVPFLTP